MRKESIHTPPHPISDGEPPQEQARDSTAVDAMLQLARKLHRAAQKGPISVAMPAIRRAHAAGVFAHEPLKTIYQRRHALQRKHFLRTLAVEAGFADWETYLPVLREQCLEAVAHLLHPNGATGSLNHWFSTYEQAQAFANQHGHVVLTMGKHAMVPGTD
ncbi:hypothetical protein [Rhodoferax aquaticus]|uniref:Uncharacterized protein n=1 Tax=Rhodoferax aquaticus TaxID=2527691 RepID=A0A515EQW0_9BURK|nr:hypothetical protein [Rhodoferax aquaticus]QDL55052.1 hypothetical protein EXZ61_13235 [Rhodoferax aquaticus]